MQPDKKRAEIFVFTSFQGGTGKSSTAWRFAKQYQKKSQSKGLFIELNLFTPSNLIQHLDLGDQIRTSFLDYFMGDWYGLRPEELGERFTEHEGLYLIPFIGNRSKESLSPCFSFHEVDAVLPMERLFWVASQAKCFVVIDLALGFSPLPIFLLKKSDAIFYLYTTQPPSPAFAQRFLFELNRFPQWKSKVVFLRNLVDEESQASEAKLFDREFALPIGGDLVGEEQEARLEQAVADLAERALTMPLAVEVKEVVEVAVVEDEALREYQRNLRTEVVANLEKRFGLTDQELKVRVERLIDQAFDRRPPPTLDGRDARTETKKLLIDEILGLGPLEEFMRDEEVDEIMVNGPGKIFVEKRGRLLLTGKTFANVDHVRTVIDRILMPVGRSVNERTPYVDARLGDGSRVHAIIPPLSLTGPMLTIRRFSRIPYSLEDLVYRFKTLTPKVGEFLKLCVRLKKNIVVSGGASSGKTTLLNVLSTFILPDERVISIEDSAELRLFQENLGRLEARQQGTEAKTSVTIRDLVRNSLRMRPDRIVVGECRGPEALDMLQAMNTGHDGSLTTLHSNSPRDALARLETMVLMAGVELPLRAIREQIASSVNIVVQSSRLADGSRRLLEVVEVVGIEDTTIKTEVIFKFEKKWINEDGRVFGELIPTGYVPQFIRNIPGNLAEKMANLFKREKAGS